MKKHIYAIAVLAAVGFALPATASAGPEECKKISEDEAWYQGKAAALWTAYASCKSFEWVSKSSKKHCEAIHHKAEKYQKRANSYNAEWHKQCIEK